jgi:surfactin synthase thioesterase subunit
VPKELARLIPFFGNNKPRELIYYINLFRSFENARYRYTNTETINIPILYIGALEEKIEHYKNWSVHSMGHWSEEHVEGDHTTIFDTDHVKGLAEAINRNLESTSSSYNLK